MNHAQLSRGTQIQDERKDLCRVLEHFGKSAREKNPVDFVVEYLKECRNVGTETIRKELSNLFIETAKKHLGERIAQLDKEFDEL